MRNWVARFITVLVLVVGGIGVASAPAVADTPAELATCTVGSSGVGPSYGGGFYTGSGDWYAYGPNLFTLNASACEDIQLTNLFTMSIHMKYRIRFFPSGGGSYTNSWKPVYTHSCWSCNFILATDVLNATTFRVEGVEQVYNCPSCTQETIEENFNIAW